MGEVRALRIYPMLFLQQEQEQEQEQQQQQQQQSSLFVSFHDTYSQ